LQKLPEAAILQVNEGGDLVIVFQGRYCGFIDLGTGEISLTHDAKFLK
jgi:hypothetical protein